MKTIIYFKQKNKLHVLRSEERLDHKQAYDAIIDEGFVPDDKRIMLTYTAIIAG